MQILLTTETVRANERLRIWTGSLVCCFPLEALPSFEGSLMLKYKGAFKWIPNKSADKKYFPTKRNITYL